MMAGLGTTLANLTNRAQRRAPPRPDGAPDRLRELGDFGANPGALRARYHLPPALPPGAPLVVVLHGCTQTASAYDLGAGWSTLADAQDFALLFPEQQRANNPNLCFNWFTPADTQRGGGEPQSIQQMILAMIRLHDLDARRVFVTGLSAGGAMATVMLATYPELFAGGAVIAGLPYGHVRNAGDAFARMRGDGYPADAELGRSVRSASEHDGPWPGISVWHGSADTVVDRSNAERILGQWRAVHGLPAAPTLRDRSGNSKRRVWHDAKGRALVTAHEIVGMGHGTPLGTRGDQPLGVPGPHMLEVGVNSTRLIAESWGLATADATASQPRPAETVAESAFPPPAVPSLAPLPPPLPPGPAPRALSAGGRIGAVIEDALRAAGLMR